MHIYEGILTATTQGQIELAAGWATAAAGTAIALRQLDYERLPRVGVLSAVFFVASLIHVPVPGMPTIEHLVLSGLLGLILGWAAFPAVLVALALQALMFSMGGPLVLGVNTTIMAFPAVICYYLFRRMVHSPSEGVVFVGGFAAGATAIVISGALNGGCLVLAGRPFVALAAPVVLLHLALAVVEGFVTGSVVVFLRKVRPELLNAPYLQPEAAMR